MQRTELIGNLGRDPEMSYTPSGRAVTRFSVAVNRKWTDDKGQRQEHTDWFNVVCWQQLAETASKYLAKGSKVYVAGRLESRTYTGKDGAERTAWDLVASDLEMLDTRAGAADRAAPGQQDTTGSDDIPF